MKRMGGCWLWLIVGAAMAADPVPLRREVVTPDRLAAELARSERGTWQRLSRAEFEARVQKAAGALEQKNQRPQLIRAEYSARLDGEQLIGTAKWTIHYGGNLAGRLSIEPFSVALRSAKWSDGADAIIGPLDRRAPGWELLVEGGPVKILELEWSARGQLRPDGIHFDLQWPAAGTATCTWNLPADQALAIEKDQCQLVDVRPIDGNRRTWILAAGGSSRLDLLVTPLSGSPQIWFVRNRQTFQLQSTLVQCWSQLEVSTALGRQSTIELEIDPQFLVSDITAPKLKKWEALDGGLVRLSFHEPIAGATITIQGATPPTEGQSWSCPTIGIRGGVSLGETIVLEVPADVALDDFRPGSFLLIDGRTAPTGHQTLTLESLWAKRGEASRPNGRIHRGLGMVDVSEQRVWDIEIDRQLLSSRMQVRPIHGPLSNWSIALPTDWDVESVECKSNESMRWTVRRGGADRSMLQIEFDRPVPPGTTLPIMIEYRGRSPASLGSSLPFPDPEPRRTRSRQVALAIRYSPLFRVEAHPGPMVVIEADMVGPKPDATDDISFSFPMGRVEGHVSVRPRPARYTATGGGRLRVRNDELVCEYRVVIRPEQGAVAAVTLMAPAPAVGAGEWRASAGATIRQAKRLDGWGQFGTWLAGQSSGLDLLPALATLGHTGAIWQIVFDRPVNQPVTLDYAETLRREPERVSTITRTLLPLSGCSMMSDAMSALAPPPVSPLVAPALWSVVGAMIQDHTWRYYDLSNHTRPPAEWRSISGVPTLRYRGTSPSILVDLADRSMRRLAVSEARVTASITGDHRILVRYQAAVRGAGGSRVPMELPAGAALLDARAAGRIITGLHRDDQRLEFDLPGDSATLPVEVVYSLPGIGEWPIGRLNAAEPRWPGDVGATLWSWQLPPGWEACNAARVDPLGKSAAPMVDLGEGSPQVFPGDGSTLWVTQPMAFRRACWILGTLTLALVLAWQPRRIITLSVLLLLMITWSLLSGSLRPMVLGPIFVFALVALWQSWNQLQWRWQAASATMVFLALTVCLNGNDLPWQTVFIVPTKDQEPETVYASAALMTRLDELALGDRPTAACVLQSAKYETRLGLDQVETQAEWIVNSFAAGGAFVAPLAGSELIELKVDQQAAIPTIQNGNLRIPLPKVGRLVVQARMIAKMANNTGLCTMRCDIPPSLQAQWIIDCGAELHLLPVATGHGAIAKSERRWVVDLGRANALECAWHATAASATPASIREAYLWDLRRPAARLFGIFKCDKPGSQSSEWRIDVPLELEPITVRTIDRQQLDSWKREGGSNANSLVIRLNGTSQPIVAVVEFAPKQPLNTAQPLPIPAGRGVTETIVAWRGGPEARPGPVRGYVAVSEETIRANWIVPAQLNDVNMPIRAWRKSITANDPVVGVNLGPLPIWKGEPAIRWQLGPKRAEVVVRLSLTCDSSMLPLVEFDIPATVTIAQATGPHVAQWTRAGTHLQIWLDQPQSATTIELRGWTNRTDDAARFDTPAIRLLNASPGVQLSVAARPGWDLTPMVAQQLTASRSPASNERVFRGDRSNYRLIVQPKPTHRTTDYRIDTTVNMNEGRPSSQSIIEARSSVGNLGSVVVTMAVSPDDVVVVQAPDLKVMEQPTLRGHRTWLVAPMTASSNKWYLQLQVTSRAASSIWTIPKVQVDFAGQLPAKLDQEISINPGLRVVDATSLAAVSANRWRVISDDWLLEVELAPTRPPRR